MDGFDSNISSYEPSKEIRSESKENTSQVRKGSKSSKYSAEKSKIKEKLDFTETTKSLAKVTDNTKPTVATKLTTPKSARPMDHGPALRSLQIAPRSGLDLVHVGRSDADRHITPSEANIGPTRKLAAESDQIDEKKTINLGTNSPDALHLADGIADDGARRIQTLYYQLLSYWDEGCDVDIKKTQDQHGKSEVKGWSAAHSALLPALKDNHIEKLREKVATGLDDANLAIKCKVVGMPEDAVKAIFSTKDEARLQAFDQAVGQLSAGDKDSLLSESSHLYHVTNSTIVMPHYVNQLHGLIEAELRPEALRMINSVSKDGVEPYIVMRQFSGQLEQFLLACRQESGDKLRKLTQVDNHLTDLINIQGQIAKAGKYDRALVGKFFNKMSMLSTSIDEINKMKKHSLAVNVKPVTRVLHGLREQQAIFKSKMTPQQSQEVYDSICGAALPSHPFKTFRSDLVNSVEVAEILIKASTVPTEAVLLGKVQRGGGKVSRKELLEHKYQLLSHEYDVKRIK